MRKIIALGVAGVVVATGLAVWKTNLSKQSVGEELGPNHQATNQEQQEKTHIRLFAAGDFIAHDSVNSAASNGNSTYDYLKLMPGFKELFTKADLRFCNVPILTAGAEFPVKGYPNFNAPAEFVRDMDALGCNLINTASNHSFDFNQQYIDASVKAWDNKTNVLAVAGQNRSLEEKQAVRTFTHQGVKFAFLAYTTYSNKNPSNNYGLNMYNQNLVTQQIKKAKEEGVEFIIVSMRWGIEYSNQATQQQQTIAKFLSDQGVNLVLGHGPHVLQSVQTIEGKQGNKTAVWYSLGNFLNSQIPAETQFNGIASINISIKNKTISSMEYIPIYQHYEWTAQEAAAEDLGARKNLKLVLLEDATQEMINSHQLKTSVEEQKSRLKQILNQMGAKVELITASQL